MLQLRETRIVRSNHLPVLSSVIIPEEGVALVYVKENGDTKVQPSTGAVGEVFAGVSLSRNSHPGQLPYVQEQLIPQSGVVTLVRAPITGQLLVRINGVIATLVTTAPAAANEVQLVNGIDLHFFTGTPAAGATPAVPGVVGALMDAQMMYTPTVIEARSVIGDQPVGGLASSAEGVIGVLQDATISTSFFDASVDWSTALYVKLAAGGMFTVGTQADHVPNVIVRNSPNAANAFLILSMNVG